jgi:hypothetical protein
MRRWYLPITVLGLGGIGALLMTERGRNVLRKLLERFWHAPELLDWEGSLDSELDRIQTALDCIADSIQPRQQLGH